MGVIGGVKVGYFSLGHDMPSGLFWDPVVGSIHKYLVFFGRIGFFSFYL